jgi:hypothetical protein
MVGQTGVKCKRVSLIAVRLPDLQRGTGSPGTVAAAVAHPLR